MVGLIATAFAIFAMANAQSSSQGLLSGYLAAHPWDNSRLGPLLVVDPAGTNRVADGDSLAAYGRATAKLGSVSVIAPTTMVILDADFQDPPNIYDGLPEVDKVEYLMSTLSDEQWKFASHSGIGLSDLSQDQAAVFRSIISQPFSYAEGDVQGIAVQLTNVQTVPQDDVTQLKIYVSRELDFMARLTGRENVVTGVSLPLTARMEAGKKHLFRFPFNLNQTQALYGHEVRRVLSNESKKSDLNYSAPSLAAPIDLPQQSTIADLLAAIQSKSGLILAADKRVANLPVMCQGVRSKMGELLQALALAVTGTFRHLAGRYELTSDLEGIGTRQGKIGLWFRNVQVALEARRTQWARKLGRSKGLAGVGYSSSDSLPPDEKLEAWLKNHAGTDDTLSAAVLPAGIQAALSDAARADPNLDLGKLKPSASFYYRFVLPSGEILESKVGLAVASNSESPPVAPEPGRVTLKGGNKMALAVRIPAGGDAASIVRLASGYGFAELWIQADEASTLQAVAQAAKPSGIRVRVLIRPWEAPKSNSTDETVLGDKGREAFERLLDSFSAKKFYLGWGALPDEPEHVASPFDFDASDRLDRLATLAKASGLPVVVVDSLPRGYEPDQFGGEIGGYEHAFAQAADFGFSTGARAAFLTADAIDPFDLPNPQNLPNIDLSLPFFPDSPAYPDRAAWAKFLADRNRDRIGSFLASLQSDLLIGVRNSIRDYPPSRAEPLTTWQKGDPLPSRGNGTSSGYRQEGSILRIPSGLDSSFDSLVGKLVNAQAEAAGYEIAALDLTQFESPKVAAFLHSWFNIAKSRM